MRLVKLFKLSWDGLRLEDEGQVIYRGRGSEAAKIYRIDGQFYVFVADNDARDGDRKQVVLRGPRLDGPLERKVVLERGNGATRSCSQGALVQVREGSWWLIEHRISQRPCFCAATRQSAVMSVTLEIPDDVSQAMRVPPPELEARLRLELAAALYAQQVLSLGKTAQLAGLTRFEMNSVLARRGVPMHYSAQELAEDLAYARSC